ncbi:MAG: polysaccharide deacetylase family protein [Prevotellaceae bacterium]|jgi:peptidoglycan/xylan/chitin deacetylase (PgdA/CDA1 family)|nr:polysaccharide deacetylase family protein [Prevotellaceae bacterium]
MKLRYILITLIAVAATVDGLVRLLVEMNHATLRPITLSQDVKDIKTPEVPEVSEVPESSDASEPSEIPETSETSETTDARDSTKVRSDHHVYGTVSRIAVPSSDIRILFLTFNAYTDDYPALFDLLEQRQVKATLFLTGVWVRRNADRARTVGALPALFEIENHGNRNIPLSSRGATVYERHGTSTIEQALHDAAAGAEATEQATGRKPRYIRPYYNYIDNAVVRALGDRQITTIGATILADGGGLFRSEKIKNNILDAPHGSILLFNVDARYPNILAGLQAALDAIEKERLPIRFAHLADYEPYFDYEK